MRLRAYAVALAAWASLACASPTPTPLPDDLSAPGDPLVWRASGPAAGAGPLYLLGSVHLGSRHGSQLGPAVEAAYGAAEELVVEVDLSGQSPDQLAADLLAMGRVSPGRPLRKWVSAATWDALERYCTVAGASLASFAAMKPWLAANVIVLAQFHEAGYDGEFGVDRLMIERAEEEIPIAGLETAEFQLDLLNSLPVELQELLLRDALEQHEAGFASSTHELIDAWTRGDAVALSQLIFEDADVPEYRLFYERVFFERNERMARDLAALSVDGRVRLVVVGVGHMLGPRGIPALLETRGFTVEQLGGTPKR